MNVWDIPAFVRLTEKGWKGEISKEQREYYINRYKKADPHISDIEAVMKLADYLGGSKARYDLNGRGIPVTDVGSFIQINFAHPVPGAPDGLFNNTLYYRTIPASMARTHIAPWRSKGYLQMVGETITPKLVHPGMSISDLVPSIVTLVNEDDFTDKLVVQTDYTHSEDVFSYVMTVPPMM